VHLKLLKQEQVNPKTSRWKKIIKIRAEVSELETKKMIQQNNETKIWFFEKCTRLAKF
jgi:hypothetical protein